MTPWFVSLLARCTWAADAEPPPVVDVGVFDAWRREVLAVVEVERARCAALGGSVGLWYSLRILQDGRVTDGWDGTRPPKASRIALPRTGGFSEGDRKAASASSSRLQDCVEGALATLRLPPPPGTRSVTLPVSLELGERAVDDESDAPKFDAPAVDSVEVKQLLADVVWRSEEQVFGCLSRDSGPVEVTWFVDRSGSVAAVGPLPLLPAEQSSCVRNAIVRWQFPALEGASAGVRLRHTFDRALVAPLGSAAALTPPGSPPHTPAPRP